MSTRENTGPWVERHQSVAHFEWSFDWKHLPGPLQQVSAPFEQIAILMLSKLQDGPELATALRKLVEAKDCAVRQAVEDHGGRF